MDARPLVALVFLAPLAAGCLVGESAKDSRGDVAPPFEPDSGKGVRAPDAEAAKVHATPFPARSADAPALRLGNASAHAASIGVPERVPSNGTTQVRWLCAGAIVAWSPGQDDLFFAAIRGELAYATSFDLVDADGRHWITDRFDDPARPGNLTRAVWVANLFGEPDFAPVDAQGNCPPLESGGEPYNALVYSMERDGDLMVRFNPDARPVVPGERVWWRPETTPSPSG